MRQVPAILLLALFGFSLIEPALLADTDSKLPACCRREGQHHCAMTGAPSVSSGPSIQAVCPAFPKAGAAPAYSKSGVVWSAQAVLASIISHPAGRTQAEALCRVSFSRTRQKRGPPSLLS